MKDINRFGKDTIEAMIQSGRIIGIVAARHMPWTTGYAMNPAGGPRKLGAIYDKCDRKWYELPKWIPAKGFIAPDGSFISDDEMIIHIKWMNEHIGNEIRWADEYVGGAEW